MGRCVLMFEYSKVQAVEKDALMRRQCMYYPGGLAIEIPLIW